MDKLLNILSELHTNEYIAREINEIEFLSNKLSEHTETFQADCDEFQRDTKEVETLKQEEQFLFSKIKDREKEFAVEKEKFDNLQSEYESLASSDENDFRCLGDKTFKNVEYQMKLFGLDIQAQYTDPTLYQAKISFADEKYVVFNYDIIQNTYDLLNMEPRHKSFEEIRLFLLDSGDIVGFLCRLRKFFGLSS